MSLLKYTERTIQKEIFDLRGMSDRSREFITLLAHTLIRFKTNLFSDLFSLFLVYIFCLVVYNAFTLCTNIIHQMFIDKLFGKVPSKLKTMYTTRMIFEIVLPYLQLILFVSLGFCENCNRNQCRIGFTVFDLGIIMSSFIVTFVLNLVIMQQLIKLLEFLSSYNDSNLFSITYSTILLTNIYAVLQIISVFRCREGFLSLSEIFYIMILLVPVVSFVGYHILIGFRRKTSKSSFVIIKNDVLEQFDTLKDISIEPCKHQTSIVYRLRDYVQLKYGAWFNSLSL